MTNEKPNVLILGGVGFIGRHFIHYLLEHQLAGHIRVADKVLPQTAYLSEQFKQDFKHVEYKQCNLINPGTLYSLKTSLFLTRGIASIASCFEDIEFDYVFNFAGETKYSQVPEIYHDRIYNLSVNCAKEAAKRNVKLFVEMSTAEVYEHSSVRLLYSHRASVDLVILEPIQ